MLYITKLSQVVSFNVSSSLFMCHWQDLIHSLADVQSLKGHVHQCLIRQIVIYAFSFFLNLHGLCLCLYSMYVHRQHRPMACNALFRACAKTENSVRRRHLHIGLSGKPR